MWEELAWFVGIWLKEHEREKAGLLVVGSSSVLPLWGGKRVTLWGPLPAWQLRTLSLQLCLSLSFSFPLCLCLSVWLLRPMIYQFTNASNIPISRHTQKQLNCSRQLKKSEYKTLERPLDVWIQSSVQRREAVFTCGWQLKRLECLAMTVPECSALQSKLNYIKRNTFSCSWLAFFPLTSQRQSLSS